MGYPKLYPSRRRLLSFALIALVIGSVFGDVLWNFGGVYFFKRQTLTRFSSYQELVAFLTMEPQDVPQSLLQRLLSIFKGEFYTTLRSQSSFLASIEGSKTLDYSTTNIQVEGVDEADIVKTDGEYLYLASGSVVYILSAYPPENAKVLSKLALNTTVAGIFVNDGKLVVFQNGYDSYVVYRTYSPYYDTSKTSVIVYDVSNRSRPVLERYVTVDGYYFSARMIGDYVYAVVNKPVQVVNGSVVILPEVRSGNVTVEVNPSNIYHPELPDYYYSFTNIIAINVKDPDQKPKVESFLLGATSCIYVSMENVYLTSHSTNIHRISIKDGNITYAANGFVPGYVLNQFSMDEYGGSFRIATSDGKSNNVYVLDEELNVVGKLEGLAPGESIYSARFMGKRGYLVTFKKVDPLFVIDLEDPRNPKVLGKLKIPGYSDYLHPYDETHLIGVGKETVEEEEGNFAWYQGVKLSLFDVSNVSQPKELDKVVIGDRGTDSPVLRDHKAFLFSRTKHFLALPILLAVSGDFVWQGAYVFNITIDKGFVLKGRVTHLENATDLMKSGLYASPYLVKRSLYIDNVLYTISDGKVAMNSLDDLKEISIVKLP